MHIRIIYYVTLPASIRAVNIANYVIIFGSHCPLYGSGVEDHFSVNTGPTASIEGPSPSLVTEGSSLPICVVLNMPPTSTATVFISTQDRPSQTALGEYKHKICVVHSDKCNLI